MSYYLLTQAPPAPQPRPPSRSRREGKSDRKPPYPPSRIWSAMQYVSICQSALLPFEKIEDNTGPLEQREWRNELVERDLHPAQIGSFRAACDCLKRYFDEDLDYDLDEIEE